MPINLGNFVVLDKLGSGAFGITHKVYDKVNKRYLAFKFIDIEESTKKRVDVNEMQKEIDTLIKLSSSNYPSEQGCFKNIACYYDSVITNYKGKVTLIILMEYVEGNNLTGYIKKLVDAGKTSIEPKKLWDIMAQCIMGLQYIHRKGYAHRDLKLDNIMITNDGVVKIIDFGLACSQDCVSGFGTPIYVSPEVITTKPSSLEASQAHDVWSMGIVYYILMTFEYPYNISEETTRAELGQQITNLTPIKVNYQGVINNNFKVSNHIFNFITESMLTYEWTKRPTSIDFFKYMYNEHHGCNVSGIQYTRLEVLVILKRKGVNIKNILYENLGKLCGMLYEYVENVASNQHFRSIINDENINNKPESVYFDENINNKP